MKYLSVCSGIEAASVAWHPLGWEPIGFAEIEPFPSAVLAHRFPNVPNHGDMTKYKEWGIEPGTIDLLVGGTPCQSFSVAGLRRGLADPRGNLMLTFGAIADHLRPTWIVFENVPGLLSQDGGRAFGTFLGMLGELGYGFAECERLQGFPEERKTFILSPCVEEKNELAPSAAQSSQALNLGVKEHVLVNVLIDFERQHLQLHKAGKLLLSASFADAKNSFLRHTQGEDFARLIALMKQEGDKIITTGRAESHRVNVISSHQPNGSIYANLYGLETEEPVIGAGLFMSVAIEHLKSITSQAGKISLNLEQSFLILSFFVASAINGFIREKTQTENTSSIRIDTVCGWTRIPWRNASAEDCPDGPRYKAIGNSMAVPVMRWIGKRIRGLTTGSI